MRGDIVSFDPGSETGLIRGDDGQDYRFSRGDLAAPFDIAPGLRADFTPTDGTATQILLMPASAPDILSKTATPSPAPSPWASSATPAPSPWAGSSARPSSNGSAVSTAPHWPSLFTSFNGRLRRSHFWIGVAILFALYIAANFIPIVGILIILALIWPNLAIGVKRLHDMGFNGWFNAIPLAVNIIGGFAGLAMLGMSLIAAGMTPETLEAGDQEAIMAMATPDVVGPALSVLGVVFLMNLAFLAWIGAVDGQPGENRFGPDPKGR